MPKTCGSGPEHQAFNARGQAGLTFPPLGEARGISTFVIAHRDGVFQTLIRLINLNAKG